MLCDFWDHNMRSDTVPTWFSWNLDTIPLSPQLEPAYQPHECTILDVGPPAPSRETPGGEVWSRQAVLAESCPNRRSLCKRNNYCCFELQSFARSLLRSNRQLIHTSSSTG